MTQKNSNHNQLSNFPAIDGMTSDKTTRTVLYDIYTKFKCDHSFHVHCQFLGSVTEILQHAINISLEDETLNRWNDTIINLLPEIENDKEYGKRFGNYGKNPLTGNFEQYTIPGCILEPIIGEDKRIDSVLTLKALLTVALIKKSGTNDFTVAAHEIRKTCKVNKTKRESWLKLLPLLINDTNDLETLEKYCINEKKKSQSDDLRRNFFYQVQKITTICIGDNRSEKLIKKKRPLPRKKTNVSNVDNSLKTKITSPREFGCEQEEQIHTYVEPYVIDDNLRSNKAANVDERRSAGWLERYSEITPFSRVALNYMEIDDVRYFVSKFNQSENMDTQRTELLLCYVIALGMSIEEIYKLKLGASCDLTRNGIYRHRIVQPANAFKTNKENENAFVNNNSLISFKLPNLVTDLQSNMSKILSESISIERLIGWRLETSNKRVNDLIKERRHPSYNRISINRLRLHLRTQLSIKTRDPLVIYLITGKDNEDAPVGMYYGGLPISKLQTIYTETLQGIFPK